MPRTYIVRKVDESDRAKWEGWAQEEGERGEFDMAQLTRDTLRKWEQEQGQEREELVCPICQRRFLRPTARVPLGSTLDGTSRRRLGIGCARCARTSKHLRPSSIESWPRWSWIAMLTRRWLATAI